MHEIRTASVEIDDVNGFHVVKAWGAAGTWYVATRSADVGFSIATYAAVFGELPCPDWALAYDVDEAPAPFAVSYKSRADVEEQYATNERVWMAASFGQLSRQAVAIDDPTANIDRTITRECFALLESGESVVRHSHIERIPETHAVAEDSEGIARLFVIGREYVNDDGSIIKILPTDQS